MEQNFNVIIPAAYKDFSFLKKTVSYVSEFLKPRKIYLLIDMRLVRFIPKEVRERTNVILVDENEIVDGVTFKSICNLLGKHGMPVRRTGWFLQQFLKIGFAQTSYCDTDFYLSWDADTLPLRNISFFSNEGKPIFTKKKEHNQAYFDTLQKLLPLQRYADFSYIAEHMMFNKKVVCEMLQEIESSKVEGITWFDKIVNATDANDVNSFSEFETYGNYCLNHYPEMYDTQVLNTFRKAGYIAGRFISNRKLHYMSFDLDTASFELGDYPCGLEKFICFGYHKLLMYKEKFIKRMMIK